VEIDAHTTPSLIMAARFEDEVGEKVEAAGYRTVEQRPGFGTDAAISRCATRNMTMKQISITGYFIRV